MTREPQDEYESARRTTEKAVEAGDIHSESGDAILTLCSAFDRRDTRQSLPRDIYGDRRTSHKEYKTLAGWIDRLLAAARDLDSPLTEASAEEINALTTEWVKGDEKSTSRIRDIEHALSKFYRYHDDFDVTPDEIVVHQCENNDTNSWDARDLLNPEERAALRTVADHPRDLAVYHLALYTGQRNTSLRQLRVKDIKIENSEWYFNTTADGLKNIHRPNDPRPLFQAERAVREWLDMHPDPKGENYLITAYPSAARKDPTNPVSRQTIYRTTTKLKERTQERDDVVTVDKPCHPHMMRHNFVSMCRNHPDIQDSDIKFYIGHAPDSNVMETTYSHLSSEDHNLRGHDAFGTVDAPGKDDDSPPPWDTTCTRCMRVLAPGDDICDNCGTERGPTPWDDPGDVVTPEEQARQQEEIIERLTDSIAANIDYYLDQGAGPEEIRDALYQTTAEDVRENRDSTELADTDD